ncbi:MAG: glycosyltransferase [Bacteroidetes bacterium]|nr:glycosyltransferase [Bacteroidota bacterium]
MKILFIANRFPYPPFRGDKLKIYNLAKRIAKHHELHLITFAENKDDLNYLPELQNIFTKTVIVDLPKWKSVLNVGLGLLGSKPLQVNYFKSSEFRSKLDLLLKTNEYDAIHVQHLRMAQYAMDLKQNYRILDLPDAFSLYWQRRKSVARSLPSRILDNIESSRVLKYEKQILQAFDLNLVCSMEDLNFLKDRHKIEHIRLLPNGVDTDKFHPMNHDYSHAHTLLFTGNMDYDPNVDAVLYFAEQILPVIQNQYPNVKFVIAGQRPIDKVKALHNGSSIEVTGFIPDLSQTYNEASVVVAPLRFGAGTQNKVLEAMAMGIPVVCSHIGFEGLGISDGEGAFMRKDPESFARQVMTLLGDEQLRIRTGQTGVNVIQQNFSWDQVSGILERYLEKTF